MPSPAPAPPAISGGPLLVNALIGFAILVIMFAMGIELTAADFRRIAAMPRAAIAGLVSQLVLLPLLAFGLATILPITPAVAVGMIILSACPGGPPSNILSYLAGGHVALSVTLPAISSVITVATIPFVSNLGLAAFGEAAGDLRLPVLETLARLAVVSLLPIGTGIFVRMRFEASALRWQPTIKKLALFLFAIVLIVIVIDSWEDFLLHLPTAALASLCLGLGALALGYGVGRLCRLDGRDRFTIALEVGVQNIALASMIVLTQLERPAFIAFPSTYTLVSLPAAALLASAYSIRGRQPE